MKKIEVVAAIIFNEGKVLCVQRKSSKYSYISKKYEFPGGKVEAGESNEEALIREIKEELDMSITVLNEFISVEHSYPDFSIRLCSYICSCKERTLQLLEHVDYKWLNNSQLHTLDWAAADIPIMEELTRN